MQIAHSAYPDSPLGPDAFREYGSLLVQDYEELLKRCEAKSKQSGGCNAKENLIADDDGWSQLTSSKEETSAVESGSGAKETYEDEPTGHVEDVGQKLFVSVHHFPLILCPLSPRVFVLPSEGSVAEAYLSAQHENSLSPGLPPLSAGLPPDGEDTPPGATLTAQFLYHLAAKVLLCLIFSITNIHVFPQVFFFSIFFIWFFYMVSILNHEHAPNDWGQHGLCCCCLYGFYDFPFKQPGFSLLNSFFQNC